MRPRPCLMRLKSRERLSAASTIVRTPYWLLWAQNSSSDRHKSRETLYGLKYTPNTCALETCALDLEPTRLPLFPCRVPTQGVVHVRAV